MPYARVPPVPVLFADPPTPSFEECLAIDQQASPLATATGETPSPYWVQSGVRPRYRSAEQSEALGCCAYIAASALGVERAGDSATGVASVVGGSWLRAAAWLRSRGAVVGHAVSKLRLFGAQAAEYEMAAATPLTRSRALVRFGRLEARSVARWMDSDRIAIILVAAPWGDVAEVRPMVVVGAGAESLSLFDPARGGVVDEVGFDQVDSVRKDPRAAFEVLLARAR